MSSNYRDANGICLRCSPRATDPHQRKVVDTLLPCTMAQAGAISQADSFGKPSAMFYLRSLEKQLQDFKSGIPDHLATMVSHHGQIPTCSFGEIL